VGLLLLVKFYLEPGHLLVNLDLQPLPKGPYALKQAFLPNGSKLVG
jgi:hypothetical protein